MTTNNTHTNQRVFITGANRGIGLEITRQCLARGAHVFASCRQPDLALDLNKLKISYPDLLKVLQLDVTNQEDIISAVGVVRNELSGLDLLFNNAGINPKGEEFSSLEAESLLTILHVNSVAHILIAQGFMELLKTGHDPKIINITSQLGSLTRKDYEGSYGYSGSKAALNMFNRMMSFDLQSSGIITIVMHPGWVRTDMGGMKAPLTVHESVSGILQVMDKLTMQDSGRFLAWDGSEIPW